MTLTLTPDMAARFARIALGHVTRPFPHKADHIITGPDDLYSPQTVHPVFYGSFDWHSCVHSYWLLIRIRRLFPDLEEVAAITAVVDAHFTESKIAVERAYLDLPTTRGFERPYGWAWLLKLAAELDLDPSPEGVKWCKALAPLAAAFVARFIDYLPLQTYPIRAGTHANSAFALTLAGDYAIATHDERLLAVLRERAATWFNGDLNAPCWEPSGDDFLSSTLCTAQAMARLMPHDAFQRWLGDYLPHLEAGQPTPLFTPATVTDRSDGKIAHLDGLNLSRAWAWRELAPQLDSVLQARANATAERHLEAALPHLDGDYMGEHWLASFALLALTA